MNGSTIAHVRTCPLAFPRGSQVRGGVKLDFVGGSTISERESALRRAICGACPHVPFGFVRGMVRALMTAELEAAATDEGKANG